MKRSFLANILYQAGPSSHVIVEELVDIIKSIDSLNEILNDVDINEIKSASNESQKSFTQVISGVNPSVNYYSGKSPVLGVVGEHLANKSDDSLGLTKLYIEYYFYIVINLCGFTEQHYEKWLNGEYERIFGCYQSCLERAGRAARTAISSGSCDSVLLDVREGRSSVAARPLIVLIEYASGKGPMSRLGGRDVKGQERQHITEDLAITYVTESDSGDHDVVIKTVNVPTPINIKNKKQLLNSINKANGRANNLAKINQLHPNHQSVLKPSFWMTLDQIILDENFDITARQLICTMLLTGRPAKFCIANIKKIFRYAWKINLLLNFPTTKVGDRSDFIPVNNNFYVPVPFRYAHILLQVPRINLDSFSISTAKKILKNVSDSEITMEKVQKLFVYMVANRNSKTMAAAMFQSPIPTSKTQLHYAIYASSVFHDAYVNAWFEFEAQLHNPVGFADYTPGSIDTFVGSDNFSSCDSITRSLTQQTDSNRHEIIRFIRFAGINGSRAVIKQSINASTLYKGIVISVVNDKNRSNGQFARLSILPTGVMTQIDSHGSHVRALRELSFRFRERSIESLAPKHFSKKNNLNFLMNTLRKYRRATFEALGVSDDFIDVGNGHYTVGQVVLSRHSSASVLDVQAEIEEPLRFFASLTEATLDVYS